MTERQGAPPAADQLGPTFIPWFSVASLLITPAALILAVVCAGSAADGLPNLTVAKALFPYTALGTLLTGGDVKWPLMVLAFIQYPAYGIIADVHGWKKKYLRGLAIIGIAHAVAAGLCFVGLLPHP